jgi:hypothetical protein
MTRPSTDPSTHSTPPRIPNPQPPPPGQVKIIQPSPQKIDTTTGRPK